MHIEQIYTNCLAEASYFIVSEGEAAVIDPIRETAPYLERLKSSGASLKYIFETHFHADFVSGHIDLARETGATIVYGPNAETSYEKYTASDEEVLRLGAVTIKVLHTPGHTLESTCYLLTDPSGKDHAVFTGDTLFVGDVGRPDLLGGTATKEELAGLLYDSLNNKLRPLGDDVIVYPAHGPGSACGKNIGKETWSTIGEQRVRNYAMRETDKEKFIKAVVTGLTAPPQYFFQDARINKEGYDSLASVVGRNLHALTLAEFSVEREKGVTILDVRPADDFEKGFIPGAINVGLNGTFAVWVGTLIPISRPLLIVAPEGKEEETIVRLARVGYENVVGYLAGGFDAWRSAGREIDTVTSIKPEQVRASLEAGTVAIDVRKPSEVEQGHLEDALLIPIDQLEKRLDELPKENSYAILCAGGYRSMMAASIMKAHGFHDLVNVHGGFGKVKDTDAPIVVPTAVV